MNELIAVSILVFLKTTLHEASDIDLSSTLKCHRRIYNHTVINKDEFGRLCWDTIPVLSCWGRCDSHEVSDWKFPYKRSHHPVCSHNDRELSKVSLKNCDKNVKPGTEIYEFVRAITCKCLTCNSAETSCEGLYDNEYQFHDKIEFD